MAPSNLRASWNVAPTQDAGVVVPEEGGLVYKTMRWGLVPIWSKDLKIGSSLINARVESAATKPAFRLAKLSLANRASVGFGQRRRFSGVHGARRASQAIGNLRGATLGRFGVPFLCSPLHLPLSKNRGDQVANWPVLFVGRFL